MTIVIATPPYQQFYDDNGEPLSGGKIYTYAAGTTTPQATYTDQGGLTPSANPIILDSAGRAEFWLDTATPYKYVVKTSADVTIRTIDNVTPFSTATGLSVLGTIAANTIVGNNTGSSATPSALTVSQVQSMLGLTVPFSQISGFVPSSIAGTSTTASLTISTGQASDSTNVAYISKQTTTSWAVTNGSAINGYEGGTTLPNSSTIHFYMVFGSSGTGSFASTSLTPTLPTGYNTYYRRVFSLKTTGAGALIPVSCSEIYGGAILNYLTTQTLDISTTSLGTSRTLFTLNVPTGVKHMWIGRGSTVSGSSYVIITSPDETDVAPSTSISSVPQYDSTGAGLGTPITSQLQRLTNTSAQIGARANTGSMDLYATTSGWIDFRR